MPIFLYNIRAKRLAESFGKMAKVIAKNKEAHFNYELLDIYEAGLQLAGWEVKSIRAGKVQLKNSFVSFIKGEAFISNMHVNQYMHVPGDETRPRKLLLHKSELKKLREGVKVKGYSIVPTTLKFSSKGYIKVDVALGRGKSKIDKRETIKKRDTERKLKSYY